MLKIIYLKKIAFQVKYCKLKIYYLPLDRYLKKLGLRYTFFYLHKINLPLN